MQGSRIATKAQLRPVSPSITLAPAVPPVARISNEGRLAGIRPLITPAFLLEEKPAGAAATAHVGVARSAIEQVVFGEDGRLLVIVGPCSIHDPQAALDYAARLRKVQERLSDELLLGMRVYFEKPRTTVGWKGLINDPYLDGRFEINEGLRIARRLLLDIAEIGVACATEFVDTVVPQFLGDLIAWSAIGARTVESQVHRALASGLPMPVAFKNSTNGEIQAAVDAVRAAAEPHHFISMSKQGAPAIVSTRGNDACHVILRGSPRGPNYSAEHVRDAAERLAASGLRRAVMIDCSHGNSQKDAARQRIVADNVAEQLRSGSREVIGVMVESHLVGGRQELGSGTLRYGQSITDACLGWDETADLLESLARAVKQRRALLAAR